MNVFICARQGDAEGYSGRLRREILSQAPTTRFVDDLGQADTMFLLIGPRWARPSADKPSALMSTGDAVRRLLETAHHADRRVVPVVLDKAREPTADDLPPSLAWLLQTNARRVSHQGFREDVKELLAGLSKPDKDSIAVGTATVELVTEEPALARLAWEKLQFWPVRFVVDGVDRGTTALVGQTMRVTVEPGSHEVALHSLSVPKQVRTVTVQVGRGETARVRGSRQWLMGTIRLERVT